MRLQIIEFQMLGGNHYTVIEVPEGMPNELAELGGSKVVEVSQEEGEAILLAHAKMISHQVSLALMFAKK